MNRTVVIGGVVAVAVLLGLAAWLLWSGRSPTGPGGPGSSELQGPIALNQVDVVTDHGASQSEDGRKLNVTFPKFELVAKGGETKSAVFSTTWHLKVGPDERVLVATATLNGYMKSSAPPPATPAAPAAAPTTAAAPATTTPPADGTTPPADAAATPAPTDATAATAPATTPAEQPAAPPAPAKPVAGDGVARVVVSFGGDTSVSEWRDATGEGGEHRLAKAVAFTTGSDLREGGTIPVTVTVELSGGSVGDTMARINAIDLQLFAESAPLAPATPPATTETAPVTPPPADGSTTVPVTPPADGTTAPATPPAEGTTTTPPASGTTPQ